MNIKKCPVCDKAFECRADSHDCWCMQHKLSATTLLTLRNTYTDCLCPQCLSAAEEKGTQRANDTTP